MPSACPHRRGWSALPAPSLSDSSEILARVLVSLSWRPLITQRGGLSSPERPLLSEEFQLLRTVLSTEPTSSLRSVHPLDLIFLLCDCVGRSQPAFHTPSSHMLQGRSMQTPSALVRMRPPGFYGLETQPTLAALVRSGR